MKGLSGIQAANLLKKYGPNKLPERSKASALIIFLNQFKSLFLVVLVIALIFSTFLSQRLVDSVAIGIIILLNAIIGFAQEYSAEKSLLALKKLTVPTCTVIRDDKKQIISSHNLVIGDIVVLKAGDIVPADGRLLESVQLFAQESILTGESNSVYKTTDQDDQNLLFMGTAVVKGKGNMIVTATGINTRFGKIAANLRETKPKKQPLDIQLQKLGYQLLIIFSIIVFVIFLLSFLKGESFLNSLLTCVSLAVSAIPEALPTITTIVLAIGVRKMVKKNVLIRKLSSIQTLGSVDIICTDKTGTLTLNEMIVEKYWINNNIIEFSSKNQKIDILNFPELKQALKIGFLCNDSHIDSNGKYIGDPTENALLDIFIKSGLDKTNLGKEYKLVDQIPFDSDRKRMSVLLKDGHYTLFTKGSPESVLRICKSILIDNKIIDLTKEELELISKNNEDLTKQGYRVLALAYKDMNSINMIDQNLEQDLIFVGLVCLVDPVRPESIKAVKECQKAGIKIIMITGDHKNTAINVAKTLDILDHKYKVLTGEDLDKLSDKDFSEIIETVTVYARVNPEHKLRIVKALQAKGHIIAMTGDGVNDAPAIKAANVGLSMGLTGTQVTKETSDIIILDDNFASIENAIKLGRGIYDNIVKFVKYLLLSHFAELLIIFFGLFFTFGHVNGQHIVVLLPIQIIWIHFLTDGLPAIALSFDPIPENVMDRPPRNPNEKILDLNFFIKIAFSTSLLIIGVLFSFHLGLQKSPILASTMALTNIVMLEFVRIYLVRKDYGLSFFSNIWIILALIASLLMQVFLIYTPFLQRTFKTCALSFYDWQILFGISFVIFILTFLSDKILSFLKRKTNFI